MIDIQNMLRGIEPSFFEVCRPTLLRPHDFEGDACKRCGISLEALVKRQVMTCPNPER